MDIKTKRISKLPQIEAIGEKTNIIVEENGEAKKIPAANMGNGLPEGEKPYQQLVTDESGKVVWENKINCIPEPSTAAVGQIVAVKAVDENDKPIEWEVKDILTETRVNELIAEAFDTIPSAEEASF